MDVYKIAGLNVFFRCEPDLPVNVGRIGIGSAVIAVLVRVIALAEHLHDLTDTGLVIVVHNARLNLRNLLCALLGDLGIRIFHLCRARALLRGERKRTDALDALGNTTAATGKGFAIGSAALTALALLASYIEELKISILHWSEATGNTMYKINDAVSVEVSKITTCTLSEFMGYFQVTLMNPKVLMGLFVGAMMSFLLSLIHISEPTRPY